MAIAKHTTSRTRLSLGNPSRFNPDECPSSLPAHPSGGGLFKWVIAVEDMPAFGVQAGHQMAIDPVDGLFQPAERKIYLFRTEAGHHFIGRYRGLAGRNFEAVTAFGDVYTKAQHGVAILGRFRGAIGP